MLDCYATYRRHRGDEDSRGVRQGCPVRIPGRSQTSADRPVRGPARRLMRTTPTPGSDIIVECPGSVPVYAARQPPVRDIVPFRRCSVPSFLRIPALVSIVFIALAAIAEAQTFRGSISGRVADTSGARAAGRDRDRDQRCDRRLADDDHVRDRRFLGAGSAARHVYGRSDAAGLPDRAGRPGRSHRLAGRVGRI